VENAKVGFLLALFLGAALPAAAQNVKITPLGSHDGELCPFDRALIFEDPDGTRIIYDVGRTVRGGSDPRLGKIDAVLLSHVHGDHIGDSHQPSANAGSCAKPDVSVNDAPNSNTVNVVLAKQAPLIVGGEMHFFFSAKVKSLGGDPAKLVRLVRFGAPRRSERSWSQASQPLTPTDCRPLSSRRTRPSSSRRMALPLTSGRREGSSCASATA
jgi:hypothetical protein